MLSYFLSHIYSLMDSLLVTDILTPLMAMEICAYDGTLCSLNNTFPFSARDEKDYIHNMEIFQHVRKLYHIESFLQKVWFSPNRHN